MPSHGKTSHNRLGGKTKCSKFAVVQDFGLICPSPRSERGSLSSFIQIAFIAMVLLGFGAYAGGQQIPAIAAVCPEAAAARTDLVNRRTALEASRGSLRRQVTQHNQLCTQIPDDSPQATMCSTERTNLQAAMRAHVEDTTSFNTLVLSACSVTPPARTYVQRGNGFIGGTGWRVDVSRKLGEPEKAMCELLKQQSRLQGENYDTAVDCKHYNLVLGVASTTDEFTDLRTRVVLDELHSGKYSAQTQPLYEKMRNQQFSELACHSNGAMLCLALLTNEDAQADHVVLYGPQVTRETLGMWDKLVRDRKVKSVQIFVNQNDPVPGAAILYADYKDLSRGVPHSAQDMPARAATEASAVTAAAIRDAHLFNVKLLMATINEISPQLLVRTFACDKSRWSLECHSMIRYREDVSCNTGSSPQDAASVPLPCKSPGSEN